MNYQERIQKVENAAIASGIPDILGYDGRFLTKFYEDVVDTNIQNRVEGFFSRVGYYKFKSFFVKSFSYFIVTLFAAIKYCKYIKIIKHKALCLNKITYVGGPFKVVKARLIHDVIPEASVYYYPCAGFTFLPQHIREFNDKKQPLFVDRFKIRYILRVFRSFVCNYHRLKKFSTDVDRIYGASMNDIIVVLLKSMYYHYHYEREVEKLSEPKHIWLLEFHSGMEMLSFQDAIKRHRPQDITVHMQHGMMLESQCMEYHNPITDYDIVCGEREVLLLNGKNKYNSKIFGFGCPLQSLGDYLKVDNEEEIYDILVLLTVTRPQSIFDLQAAVIKKLSALSDKKILLRFRPASKQEDLKSLTALIHGMDVSEDSTLNQDIEKSKIVISFSADALYHCFRIGKKAVLIAYKYVVDDFSMCKSDSSHLKVVTVDDFDVNDIKKALSEENRVDYRNDEYVKFNFGNTDTQSFRKDFNEFIKAIEA